MKSPMRLSQIARLIPATVCRVHGDGSITRRLIELGLTAGTPVEMLGAAPLGGTVRVRCGGHQLALRTEEAQLVEVRPA
jgi:ferrous iron transport protein A